MSSEHRLGPRGPKSKLLIMDTPIADGFMLPLSFDSTPEIHTTQCSTLIAEYISEQNATIHNVI